ACASRSASDRCTAGKRGRSASARISREICFGADRRKRSAVNRLGIPQIGVLPNSRCDLSPHRPAACAPVLPPPLAGAGFVGTIDAGRPSPPQAGEGWGGGWRSSLSRPNHPERPGFFL